jgi:predicted  nucleic acid-binding Zn-ribbon protein
MAPFGLFKKKGKGDRGEEIEAAIRAPAAGTISIQEAQALLQSIENAKALALASRLSQVRESAVSALQSLESIAGDMDREKIKLEELEKRFGSTAENSKRTVVSSLRREVSSDLPTIQTAADAKRFKERLESMMNRFGEVSGSHSRMLNYFMKKQADKMKGEFGTLDDLLKETKSALSAFEQDRAPVVKCGNTINTITQKLASLKSDAASAANMSQTIAEMESEAGRSRAELEALRASPEFAQAVAAAEKRADVEKRIGEFQAQMSEMFSHITRAFTKYSYGVSKETERRLSLLTEEPWRMFYEQDISGYEVLLQDVTTSIGMGKIQLKDSDKILNHLESILSSLPSLQARAKDLSAELATLKQQDVGPVRRAKDLEEAIARYDEEATRGRQSLEQQKRQAAERSAEVDELLMEVSDGIYSLAGKRYTISR